MGEEGIKLHIKEDNKFFIVPKDTKNPDKGNKVSIPFLAMYMKKKYDIKIYKGQFKILKNYYYSHVEDMKLLISREIPEEYRLPSNIRDCEELLGMDFDLALRDEDLADEKYISFINGVLNVETMEFCSYEEHEIKELVFINQVGYVYNPNAEACEYADNFFNSVTNGSKEDIDYLYQILGVLISGYRSFKNIFYFTGVKDSGKSVFMHLSENLLKNSDGTKDYSSIGLRTLTDETSKEFDRIIGKRANICAETPAMKIVNDTLLKQLSGGDSVNANVKFKSAVEFVNRAMLIFSGNTVPNFFVSDKSSISERMLIYKFKNAIPKNEQIKDLHKKINMEYVIQKAVEQLKVFIKNNQEFMVPQEIYENQEDMLMESDTIYKFFKECIVITSDQKNRISTQDLYESYINFMIAEGHLRKNQYDNKPDLNNFKITQYIFTSEMKKYIGPDKFKRNLSYKKGKADVFTNVSIKADDFESIDSCEEKIIQGIFN